MPPSLSKGQSKIVPVKMPDDEKQAAKSVLQTGETLSGFMREAARSLVKKRQRTSNKAEQMSTKAIEITAEQTKAIKQIPVCVELEDMDGTWEHFVYRVEHPVCLRSQGEDFYTKREAKSCQRWLQKYAPDSEYAKVQLH